MINEDDGFKIHAVEGFPLMKNINWNLILYKCDDNISKAGIFCGNKFALIM